MISWKFRHDTGHIQDVETPLYITIPWIVAIVVSVGYYLYLRFKNNRTTKYGDSEWEIQLRKQQSLGSTPATEKRAEKEKKQEQPEVKKTNNKTQSGQTKENTSGNVKNRSEVNKVHEEASSPDVTEERKKWNASKNQEKKGAPKAKEPEIVPKPVEPVDDGWKVIQSTKAVKKGKRKND